MHVVEAHKDMKVAQRMDYDEDAYLL